MADHLLDVVIVLPLWDQTFRAGHASPDQIKSGIAHAHVFIPVITASSHARGWVHQEIGYATAMNIPIFPISIGCELPDQLIASLQAVSVPDENSPIWKEKITRGAIDSLIRSFQDESLARYECAELHEERTMMLVAHARYSLGMFGPGIVRQRGALSSFHIPTAPVTDAIWKERSGGHYRGAFHCKQQRAERLLFTDHVRLAGARLIINPAINFSACEPKGRRARLRCLRDYLQEAKRTPESLFVAIDDDMHDHENLTIVGNFFCAESVAARPGGGYRQTVLTTHAPSMDSRIAAFDEEMERVWQKLRAKEKKKGARARRAWTPQSSRQDAIDRIDTELAKLKRV